MWDSTVQLPSGASFGCSIIPEDYRVPLQEQGLDEIKTCIKWLANNEPQLRQRIADAMFDWWREAWYDDEIDTVSTPEEFADKISLDGVNVYEDRQAHVHYLDGNLMGEHGIVLTIDAAGQITDGPNIWDWEDNKVWPLSCGIHAGHAFDDGANDGGVGRMNGGSALVAPVRGGVGHATRWPIEN